MHEDHEMSWKYQETLVICMEARSTIERGNSTICDLSPKMLMQVWHLMIVVLCCPANFDVPYLW